MPPHPDPFLYFAGAWAGLSEPERSTLLDVVDPDGPRQRLAWDALLAAGRPATLALALDLVRRRRAESRMGARTPLDRDPVRAAALDLLRVEPFPGPSLPDASHVVALWALGTAARPVDGDVLSSLGFDGRSAEWKRAWVSAAEAVLRHGPASSLVDRLASIARDGSAGDILRGEAVLALVESAGAEVEDVLHDLFRATQGDVQVEVVAALATLDALDDEEAACASEWLRAPRPSGVMLIRKHALVESLERRGRKPTR